MYNKGYRGERYSRLARVNASTAQNLRAVCMFQLGELGTFSTGPVVYDGMLYGDHASARTRSTRRHARTSGLIITSRSARR